jgi:protein-S-isoprenylcysteine O-methyltransferase Ste14
MISEQERDEVAVSHTPWWKGSRGEWYLVVQAALFLLLAFGPRTWRGLPAWDSPYSWLGSLVGGVLFLAGALIAATGAVNLGKSFTPLPRPKENATLIVTGAYRFVRHPIYSGITFMAIGWGLWLHSWLTIGYALLLFAFFDIKSRREERWLEEKFPEYADYRKRVRKLIPFVY